MGFSEAVVRWQEWQLRVLVLGSLFIQCFLFFAGIWRKRCIPSWLRFLIWLAYLGSDAVAIYALATLFNRNKGQEWVSTHRRSTTLQVLWAPILLVHLGGQDGITAYNIEDNELWRRHVLTAVSQVSVAVYVFLKSWSGDERFLAAAVLLFTVGTLKCMLKPWDLKTVSINSLVDSSLPKGNGRINSLDEYLRAAMEYFQKGHTGQPSGHDKLHGDEIWKPYDLFIDIAPSYWDRLRRLKALVHSPGEAHDLVRYGLSLTFDRLYTKEPMLFNLATWPGRISMLRFSVNVSALVTVIMEFRLSHKESYDPTDVIISYILVILTFALEYFPISVMFNRKIKRLVKGRPKERWPDQISQYNLIRYLARNKNHRKFRKLATWLLCKDHIDQLWCMKPSNSSCAITYLVHCYVARAWMEHHIKDTATYRAFNDNRGQWTLGRGSYRNPEWSLQRPFDESVIIWHLATDFCFHLAAPSSSCDDTANICREISNYMAYLLFIKPEMLMTGARRNIFRAAYMQIKKTLKVIPQPDGTVPSREGMPWEESELAQKIAQNIRNMRDIEDLSIVHDAWRVAQGLMDLRTRQNDVKMWAMILGVWVEMLCFSAGRCRGYLHAKSLGQGGEYLSYIWLLLSYMGMETLAEHMQRAKLQEEATNNGGSTTGTANA